MKDLLQIRGLGAGEIRSLLDAAAAFQDPSTRSDALAGRLVVNLFLEPSTRTVVEPRVNVAPRVTSRYGLPLLGRVPRLTNVWVATGHAMLDQMRISWAVTAAMVVVVAATMAMLDRPAHVVRVSGRRTQVAASR